MGRTSGMSDLRIPRPWERATKKPALFKKGHEKAFGKRPDLPNYCDKCRRTHSWCECAVSGNICKE